MRIICDSVEDFIENLKGGNGGTGSILEKTVWVNTTRKKGGECTEHVTFQASAVLEMGDGGEALLKYGEECGTDYMDGEKEKEGMDAVNKRMEKIQNWCEVNDVKIKPGLVDM